MVVTGISGQYISAASAAYAPTNSGDVSAIASAYQVVSSVGDDGTSVTSINGMGISGQGGGVDSATVSSIASSYAESAVSSKADSSSLSSYALSADVSGCIDTVSANSASWGGGATGDYVETSATEVSIGSACSATSNAFAQGSDNSAITASFAQGVTNRARSTSFVQGHFNTATGTSFAQGYSNSAVNTCFAQGYYNTAVACAFTQGSSNRARAHSFAQGSGNTASGTSFAQGYGNYASGCAFAQGYSNTASATAFAWGIQNSARNTAAVFGMYNLQGDGASTGNNVAFVIGDGTATTARHDLMRVTRDGEIKLFSSTADTTGFPLVSTVRSLASGMEISAGPGISLNVVDGVLVISTAAI